MNSQALTKSAIASTVLQIVMVLVNHYAHAQVGENFPAIAGTSIGAGGGLAFGILAKGGTTGQSARGGAAAGAIGGLLGSVLSLGMGDMPALTVVIASISTAVAGAIGGILGKTFGSRT